VTCTASTCARASFLSINEFAAASSRAVSKCLRLERGDGGTTISHEGSVQAELELHIVRYPCTAVQSIRTTKHEYGKEGSFLCMERCVCASAHTRSQAPSRIAKDSCTALYCTAVLGRSNSLHPETHPMRTLETLSAHQRDSMRLHSCYAYSYAMLMCIAEGRDVEAMCCIDRRRIEC